MIKSIGTVAFNHCNKAFSTDEFEDIFMVLSFAFLLRRRGLPRDTPQIGH